MTLIAFLLGMCCCGLYLLLLWVMVKKLKTAKCRALLLAGGMWLRLGLLGLAFYFIVRHYGVGAFIAFLAGFFIVHVCFLGRARKQLVKGIK